MEVIVGLSNGILRPFVFLIFSNSKYKKYYVVVCFPFHQMWG